MNWFKTWWVLFLFRFYFSLFVALLPKECEEINFHGLQRSAWAEREETWVKWSHPLTFAQHNQNFQIKKDFGLKYNIKLYSILHNAREKEKEENSNKPQWKKNPDRNSRNILPFLLKLNALRYLLFRFQIKLLNLIDYTIIYFEKQIKISHSAELFTDFLYT